MPRQAWMPAASVDWRFLPGMPLAGTALVVTPKKATLAAGLLATFDHVVVLTTETTAVFPPELLENGRLSVQHPDTVAVEPAQYDLVAFPYGFTNQPTAQLAWARKLLRENGVLYVGVPNRWSYRRWRRWLTAKWPLAEQLWTRTQLTATLTAAGFEAPQLYGVVPNLTRPKTIFPLTSAAMSLALARSWRKKAAKFVGRGAAQWPLAILLPHLLPSYAAVAKRTV